jgi:Na+-transporting methylmalonyl-CoA/oxaloacetate decarboxylase gamma subunit
VTAEQPAFPLIFRSIRMGRLAGRFARPETPEDSTQPPAKERFQKQGASKPLAVCYSYFYP